jgi:hypothetical protein
MLEPGPFHESALPAPGAAAGPDAATELKPARSDRGPGMIAVLLAAAAVLAAVVGTRASIVSNDASDSWQSALRSEVKRSAAAMEDVRYLYQSELPVAIRILEARLLQTAATADAVKAGGAAKLALQVEADTQASVLEALITSSELASKADYALSSGGFDLAKRLADLRAENPDLLALDPDGLQATGDALATRANLLMLSLFPAGLGALLGAIGQPFKRRRGLLLAAGWIALGAGGAMALAVEVMA